jgi:hypothetical protein
MVPPNCAYIYLFIVFYEAPLARNEYSKAVIERSFLYAYFNSETDERISMKTDAGVRFVKFTAMVFWVVMPYSDVAGYQGFGHPCCLHVHPEEETAWLSETLVSLHGVITPKITH